MSGRRVVVFRDYKIVHGLQISAVMVQLALDYSFDSRVGFKMIDKRE